MYSYLLPKKKFAQIRGKKLFDLFGLETYFLLEKSEIRPLIALFHYFPKNISS